ncbi:MAG: DEAD/DEAH box helicase, partial [Litorimonas sp.]
MTSFTELKLSEPLARALSTLGYDTPTPIQQQAIPHLLDGRDLLGIAQTGTGKTAAFSLPALDWIFTEAGDPPKRGARVLILAPTRELVGQIYDSIVSYGRFMMDLSAAKVVGGVSINNQIRKLTGGNDVLVATPGRLIDLLDRKAITLRDVEILILDEADQMMDMGFIHALKKIIPLLPEERQTLMFSATLPPNIKKLSKQFLHDPVQVTVSPPNSTADKVEQSVIFAKKDEKPMLLADTLLQPDVERTLVFTRTKHGADRVVRRLAQNGLRAVAIHGNKSQGQRQRALDAFKDRTVDILVATDVAARGIDIPGITHVINYEIPNVPEQYVHRIGRTARADAAGRAIAFVAPDEAPYLKDIRKLLGEDIPVEPMPADMKDRIKAIEARPKVERVNLSPEQPQRKGRGKSKKKDRSRGKKPRPDARPEARSEVRSGARSGDAAPGRTRKPRENSASKPDGGKSEARTDDQGFRRRRSSGGGSAPKQDVPQKAEAPKPDHRKSRSSTRRKA